VLYSAPKKEITALAVDGHGDIYAAGAGEKRSATPPLAPPSSVPLAAATPPSGGTTITLGAPGSSATPGASTPTFAAIPYPNVTNVGGSEVYRIGADGSPKTIWSSHEDLVYALAFDQAGRLLAGTGNRGKIFIIRGNQYTDLVQASANQVTAFARAPNGGLYAATSNLGKIFLLGPNAMAEGTYESDVFDARNFSQWGRVEVRGSGSFDVFARSGNVDNPDRNWSLWKQVDLQKDLPVDAPSARFIQWKAVLHPAKAAAAIASVTLNYLPKNVAPEVDDVTVVVGSRVPAGTHTEPEGSVPNPYAPPLPMVRDKHSIAVKWKAQDENDDSLVYSVYYRGDGESRWKLLRYGIEERFVNLDADLFPDGGYTVRVVASDAPSHSPEDALTGEGTSPRFEVDNTPPHIESLSTKVEGDKLHVTFRAVDSFSPISRAEYSLDAGDWQTVEPVGHISDYKVETYDFNVPMPAGAGGSDGKIEAGKRVASSGADEHTLVVRVYDRFENVGISKSVVGETTY
jgi:hypothetical protein